MNHGLSQTGPARRASVLVCGLFNHGLFQQFLRGDDGVEEAVAFNAAVKLSEIDQHGTDGHAGADVEALHFAGDLILDVAPDFKLPLRLDDVRRACGLDQKVYLAASSSRISPVSVWRGGNDDAVADMQKGDDLAEVVDYQVFELEAHRRVPVGQRLKRGEAIGAVLDLDDVGLDVFEIESRVVVADAIAPCTGSFARGRIDAAFGGNEASEGQCVQMLGEMPVVGAFEPFGKLFARLRSVGQEGEDSAFQDRLVAKDGRKDLVEILEERSARGEAESADVLVGREPGVDFLQVPRNAARDGEDVENLARGEAVGGGLPEFGGFGERQFAEDIIAGEASDESRGVEDVLLDPGVDAAAEHEDEFVVAAEHRVPGRFEVAGEVGIVSAHPGDFIQQDDRAAAVVDGLVEQLEGPEPVFGRGNCPVRCPGEPRRKGLQLFFVRHVGTRGQADEFDAGAAGASGELVDEAALADAAAAAAGNERGRALAPERGEVLKFGFASNKHGGDVLSVSGEEYITFGRENAIWQFHARNGWAQRKAISKEAA